MTGYRGRFAPSPTGSLHMGSLVAALGSWLCARAAGGAWLLRIEDIDPVRERPGAAAAILATLADLGLHADEPVLLQSARRDRHAAALDALRRRDLVYPCRCSRSDLEPLGGIHPPTCPVPGHVDRAAAMRVRVGEAAVEIADATCGLLRQDLQRDVGDFVVWRSDGWPAYHLAVVVDDADQGITEVVRGADLLDSAPRQRYLQRLLGLPEPAYRHLPLVHDATGRKLSKQSASLPVDRRRPQAALRAALRLLGQADPGSGGIEEILQAAVAGFDGARIPACAHAARAADAAAPQDVCRASRHNSPSGN